jgi:hypothetical protein
MWWILPWLLFLGCLGGVAVAYLFWVRRHPEPRTGDTDVVHDLQDLR